MDVLIMIAGCGPQYGAVLEAYVQVEGWRIYVVSL